LIACLIEFFSCMHVRGMPPPPQHPPPRLRLEACLMSSFHVCMCGA
jgi:hypothetical protein